MEYEGKAYLFSGPSGIGKSTYSRLWRQLLGDKVQIINDDKPALRRINDRWFVYGTPWCGKDSINKNIKVPLAGICFLHQSEHNRITRLDTNGALGSILSQTSHKIRRLDRLEKMYALLECIVQEIPFYALECRPDLAAANLSFETMNGSKGCDQ